MFTQESDGPTPIIDTPPYPSMTEIRIEPAGITKLLKHLNPSKATGPDAIPARVLRELADECAKYLTLIFQKCLQEKATPEIWKTANGTAIFKKGDRFKASNYRPVSLTCICCKIMEHVIVSNVMKHLTSHNILCDEQHGFRNRRSCETQLVTLVDELASGLDKGKQYDLAVLDFSKAFDRVPHRRLLAKLENYGVRGNTLGWIQAFLSNRTQTVVVDGASSDPEPVVSGVPQGSVLGPILFLVFINDLPQQVQSRTRLFADDCTLYRQINNDLDHHTLQDDLNKLAQWEEKWGMDFHPEKCSILRVHRKRKPSISSYSLKGHCLSVDKTSKYLGVHLTENLSWSEHIHKVITKANSTLGFLRRNLRISNEDTKSQAYFSLVRPQLEYCSSIWNPSTKKDTNKLEAVQRRAARYATNRYHNTSSVTSMIEHLGWESLESRRIKAQLTLFFKVTNDLVDIPASKYLTPYKAATRATHSTRFRLPSISTNYYKFSFFPRTIPVWNKLSATIAEAQSLASFKRGLSSLTV